MVKLEEVALGTAAVAPTICALGAIALPHLPANGSGQAASLRRGRAGGPRAGGHTELATLQLQYQHRQRAIEHLREVTIRDCVPEQRLRPQQLVPCPGRDCDLDLVPVRADRRYPCDITIATMQCGISIEVRKKCFDLALGLVPGPVQEGLAVLRRHMGRQQASGSQRQAAS